jgi:polyisoprenoid-binding protein YceI
LRSRLARVGYVQVDRPGLAASDRYVRADRMAAVGGETVRLAVAEERLALEDGGSPHGRTSASRSRPARRDLGLEPCRHAACVPGRRRARVLPPLSRDHANGGTALVATRAVRLGRRRLIGTALALATTLGAVACGASRTSTPAPAGPVGSTGAPSTAPTTTGASGARVFRIDPAGSEVVLKVEEQLVNNAVKNDAVLRTNAVAGQIALLPDGRVAEGSGVTVDLTTLDSDSEMRDNFIKRNTLKTGEFPSATFVPKQFTGLPDPLPTAGPVTGQLVGDLTVRGVTRPVTLDVQGELSGNRFTGRGTTAFKITDFGMQLPKVPRVASIEDLARLELQLTAAA